MDKRTRQRKRREYKKICEEDPEGERRSDLLEDAPDTLIESGDFGTQSEKDLIRLKPSKILNSSKRSDRMKAYCMCPRKNMFLLCEEEFEKCHRLDPTNLVHSHHRYCENCFTVVSHYHCTDCFKLIHKGMPVHLSDGGRGTVYTYYQGKECAFYSAAK